MNKQFLKQISPEITLYQYHQIPVLELEHAIGKAKIALRGGQLLSWLPCHAKQDVLWLSEVEPFELGNAIRGGIPLCYPWFGGAKQPPHGFARNRLWELTNYQTSPDEVRLELSLFSEHSEEKKQIATVEMLFNQELQLNFQGTEKDAQFAFHTYFNVSDVAKIQVHHLPTTCFNALTQQNESVPLPRQISENVDCVYSHNLQVHHIEDPLFQRHIEVEHINASEVVLWNPWHKTMSGMSETGYKTMLCLETARINQRINDEVVSVKIRVK